jgi:hypothetical protein
MGIIKGSHTHALVVHESNNACNMNTKKNGKAHAEPKKEG